MGHIVSPIKDIHALNFEAWKTGGVLKGADVLIVDDRTIIIRDKHGRLSCNRIKGYAYLPGNWPFNDSVFKGLVRLGAITKEAAQQHLDFVQARAKASDNKYEARRLVEAAAKLGIPLTKAQLAKIEKAAPLEDE